MTKRLYKIGMAIIGLSLLATPALAADYSSMSTGELSSLRGTMRNTTEEEHSEFQKVWQSRVRQMTTEERQLYMGKPENRLQDGAGMQYSKKTRIIKGINLLKTVPKTTAIRALRVRARADPKNTDTLGSQSAARQKVASWVLSPSSARNTIPNVVKKILRSM